VKVQRERTGQAGERCRHRTGGVWLRFDLSVLLEGWREHWMPFIQLGLALKNTLHYTQSLSAVINYK
jgi:hypothetical protein